MMLIELLALLVFMAMAFAFVSRDESEAAPLKDRIERLEKEVRERDGVIRALRSQSRELERANRDLTATIARLMGDPNLALRARPGFITLPKARLDELVDDNRNKAAFVEARQKEIHDLKARLGGRGGTNLARCEAAPGFLVAIDLLGDGGFRAQRQWPDFSTSAVSKVPGALQLASGRALSRAEFKQLAGGLKQWGEAQPTPCRFHARYSLRHSNIPLFQRQTGEVNQYFYTVWR